MAQAQQRIERLLQLLVQPDTSKVKEATAALGEECSSDPNSLLILFKILTTESKDEGIRQLAGVEARKRVDTLWPDIDSNTKPGVRGTLLEFALTDPSKILRHSTAQIIAEIGSHDLTAGEWAELPGQLLQAANSADARHREMGLYIMLTLIELAPELFMSDIDSVVQVLEAKIQDPDSPDVRLNALAIYAAIAPILEPEEQTDVIEAIQSSVPNMVKVLQAAIASDEEDTAMKAFEAFIEILEGSPAIFQKHFADLVRFMIEVMVNKEVDEDVRVQSVNFLAETVNMRKIKIQALKLGEEICLKALSVVVEIDDFDDEGERNPATQCLALLDLCASNLPSQQVVLPLLQAVGTYANDSNPTVRRAGILGLSMCVEGAPDFFSTQLKDITPLVLRLLGDPEIMVRTAALQAVARLAEDLNEEFGVLHETIIPAIVKNYDLSLEALSSASEVDHQKHMKIIMDCCIATDSMVEDMTIEDTNKYINELIPRFSLLLSHDSYKLRLCALSAIGSIAESAEDGFLPFFKDAMQAFGNFMTAKESEEDLDVRRACTEAIGKISLAVGPESFKPFVQHMMHASEEALHLDHSSLKEQSYILWSQFAKVYKEDFEPFLEGVVKALMTSLEQEEAEHLSEDTEDALKKLMVSLNRAEKDPSAAKDPELQTQIEQLLMNKDIQKGVMVEDVEDMDDFDGGVSAVALEKEIALESLGDILAHTKSKFIPYFPSTIQTVLGLVEHPYPGMTQSALGTLWRSYATLWEIETANGMPKWQPGIPLKVVPSNDLRKLGDVVMKKTLEAWSSQDERSVVSDINRMLAETLQECGPAPLVGENVIAQICQQLIAIITKKHECQQDPFEEDEEDADEASAEYDWLVIETAFDCMVAMAKAIGPAFAELWKMFEKPVLKHAGATEGNERAAATGSMAECVAAMGTEVTPYTSTLMKISLHRFRDDDPIAKGNAIYAVGVLCHFSKDTATILPQYNAILSKLEPMLQEDADSHLLDNAAGCVARMIIAHPDKVPLEDVLPRLVELAPAKEDWEVNAPIFQCFVKLYQSENPTIRQLTPQVITAIKKIMSEPEDHLDEDTRGQLDELVDYLKSRS